MSGSEELKIGFYQYGDECYLAVGRVLNAANFPDSNPSALESICREVGPGEAAVVISRNQMYQFLLSPSGRELLGNVVGSMIADGQLDSSRIRGCYPGHVFSRESLQIMEGLDSENSAPQSP